MSSELKKASVGGKFLGSIILFLAFAIILPVGYWLWAHTFTSEAGVDTKRADARAAKLEALQKDNDQKLTTYAWVNKDKEIVQIPITQAMKVIAPELAAKPVQQSSVKVENPYPHTDWDAPVATGTAAPAASGTAAPAASSVAPAASGSNAPAASGSATPATDNSGTIAPPPAAPQATPAPGQ